VTHHLILVAAVVLVVVTIGIIVSSVFNL